MHRFRLALLEEALGAPAIAAEHLTWALKLDPGMHDAARRLAALFARGKVDQSRLQPDGLRAALANRTVDRDLVAAAALYYLADHTSLRAALSLGRTGGWLAAARSLCADRTAAILQDVLLLDVLATGVVARPDIEALLTAMRHVVLLELKPDRLSDPKLVTFIVALVQQMWCNEFVWCESQEEAAALEQSLPDYAALLAGDATAAGCVLRHLLYRDPDPVLHQACEKGQLGSIRPEALRDALKARLETDREIRTRVAGLTQFVLTNNPTASLVAGQYEAAPYPRWNGVPTLREGEYLKQLATWFAPGRLAFTASPFDVLIAGCGTGKQAVSAAIDYGPNARVLAIDITKVSLGYGETMAARMDVRNVRFALGDIDAIDTFDPSFNGKFQVIECGGVLHHMPDPYAAWRKLTGCLAKGGIMFIALYSGVARKNLTALRAEPQFPGSGASDAALRKYRSYLKTRPATEPGSELLGWSGRDFYSASGFRDYFLHVSEKTTTLPEIDRFLAETGLTFRGFVGPPIEALRTLYPSEPSPGALARWSEFEARTPSLFSGMYQFWCTRN